MGKKIRVSPPIDLYLGKYTELPLKLLEAEFSLPYCFATYLHQPNPSAGWYSLENRSSIQIKELGEKIEFFGETKTPLDQFEVFWTGSFPEATVEVILKDGTKLSETTRYPKGHPKNPFTWEEQTEMFRKQASIVLSDDRITQLINTIRCLEEVDDFSTVGELTLTDLV